MKNYRRAIGTTTENNVKWCETFALKKLLSFDAVIFLSLLRYLVSKKYDSSIISNLHWRKNNNRQVGALSNTQH